VEAVKLHTNQDVLDKTVRQRLLAAILRFSDELADDSTRAIDISRMPEYSKIFHAYSKSLHSVRIEKIEKENAYFIKLSFFLKIQEALSRFKKLKKDNNGVLKPYSIPLIREIIERTLKMERERRYCSRYFIPYFILKHIQVEIEIDLGSFDGEERILYTLEETGYPVESIALPLEVEKSINNLENKYPRLEVPND
jgi:hypothetical protein